MRNFFVLFQKELRELLTLQILIPMLMVALVFSFVGRIIGTETKKIGAVQEITILDLDDTRTSRTVTGFLEENKFRVALYKDRTVEAVLEETGKSQSRGVIVIPAGFEENIGGYSSQEIQAYHVIQDFSIVGSMGAGEVNTALNAIRDYLSDYYLAARVPGVDLSVLKNPLVVKDYVRIGESTAAISPHEVIGFVQSQTMLLPVVLFIVMIYAGQMLVASVAAEKENKTLETLLSVPVSRRVLVFAKMAAAGLVALLMAVVYMVGFRYYMQGIMGGPLPDTTGVTTGTALQELGLVLTLPEYLLLGLTIFLSILCILVLALIAGAFAEDQKSAQGLMAPLIFLVMLPYFLVLFLDINNISPVFKYLIYAVPFSHPFMAAPNLFLQRHEIVFSGIIYQMVFFLVFVSLAARIFSSDRILTMKLRWKRKR